MRPFILAVLLFFVSLTSAIPAQAQGTLLNRVDFFQRKEASYTTAVLLPEIEIWAFYLPDNPDLEIGRLWPVYEKDGFTLYGGGYYVYWPNSSDHFVMPGLLASYQQGKFSASADLFYYASVNGGPSILYGDETFAGYEVGKGLKLGLAATFATYEWGKPTASLGPSVKYDISAEWSVSARYLKGISGPNTARLQINRAF